MATQTHVPGGWHPDPHNQNQLRFFDGAQWTDQTAPLPPRYEYRTEVNKGSIRMQTWQAHLNAIGGDGWRLAHAFEQDGNTVQVYERVVPR
jgi:hypothetical protein